MQNVPTHKLIVIEDLNKELSPIGYGFKSPIYKPHRFPIETIGQLLNISKVTAMFQVYEKDPTMRVRLNSNNYRKPFEEIWLEQNPGKEFPWANEVETVNQSSPTQEDVEEEQQPAAVEEVGPASVDEEPLTEQGQEESGEEQEQVPEPQQEAGPEKNEEPAPELSSGTSVAPVEELKVTKPASKQQNKKQQRKK